MKNEYALVNPKGRVVDKADREIITSILNRKNVMGIRGYTRLYRPKAMVGDKIY